MPEINPPKKNRYPRVLQLLPSLVSGGVERGTVDIAVALKQAAFGKPIVVSSGGPLVEQLEAQGIEHIPLAIDSKNPLRMKMNARTLADIIQQYKVDIVHARSRAPAWSGYWAAQQTGAHFITTFHGVYSRNIPVLKHAYNSVMAKGERVIAISDYVKDHITHYYDVPPEHIRLIHRGVDMKLFDPHAVPDGEVHKLRQEWRLKEAWPVILMPGRFTRWKGHLFLMKALAQLPRGLSYYCVCAGKREGSGNYYQELVDFIAEHNLQQYVRLVEPTRHIQVAYKLADVVVSASQRPEAFGRIAIEAQAMGKPIIATSIGGSRETVLHDVTGWLVDSIMTNDMEHAIEKALKLEPIQKYDIARKARAHVQEHFSLEKMCAATLKVYQEVMG